MSWLRLAKYHGLGNDFLVLVGPDPGGAGDRPASVIDASVAAALCNRHTGVGADGLITLVPAAPGGTVRMTLRNADGGLAETSGNGLRCAALAALDAGLADGPELAIETDAGPVRARLVSRDAPGGATLRVSMGRAVLGELHGGVLGRTARMVDVGNPHLVLYLGATADALQAECDAPAPLRAVELAALERGARGEIPSGLNVEAVTPLARGDGSPEVIGELGTAGWDVAELVVWERGVGETLACGSGSVAAAAALRAAGLVGDRVEMRNPGGTLLVELSGSLAAPEADLTGPAQLVAHIEVDLDWLLAVRRSRLEGATVAS